MKYQSDVIVVEGGSKSVRSWSGDGINWTIKGNASRVDELKPGKIMVLTGFAAGRVLAVTPKGSDRIVTLGPADITEIVREAKISVSEPVSLDNGLGYSAPQLPAASNDLPEGEGGAAPAADTVILPPIRLISASSGSCPPACLPPAQAPCVPPCLPPPPPPPLSDPKALNAGDFYINKVFPVGSLGARFDYDKGGLRLKNSGAKLRLSHPKVTFFVRIHEGKLEEASFNFTGLKGIVFQINAATNIGQAANIRKRFVVPVDFKVPIGGTGLPLYATLRQWFQIRTILTAKDSYLTAAGEYALGGPIGYDYSSEAGFDVRAPKGFAVRRSLVDSITGLSVGVARADLTYFAQFCICLGSFFSNTGLWYRLSYATVVVNGSSLGAPLARCHGSALLVEAEVGLGWTLPPGVKDGLNQYFKVFGVKPVEGESGRSMKLDPIVEKAEVVPPGAPVCEGSDEAFAA